MLYKNYRKSFPEKYPHKCSVPHFMYYPPLRCLASPCAETLSIGGHLRVCINEWYTSSRALERVVDKTRCLQHIGTRATYSRGGLRKKDFPVLASTSRSPEIRPSPRRGSISTLPGHIGHPLSRFLIWTKRPSFSSHSYQIPILLNTCY